MFAARPCGINMPSYVAEERTASADKYFALAMAEVTSGLNAPGVDIRYYVRIFR